MGVFDAAYSHAYGIHQLIKHKKGMKHPMIFIARLRSNCVLMRPKKDNQQVIRGRGRPARLECHALFRRIDETIRAEGID